VLNDAIFNNARLSLILDKALFFVIGHCDAMQFGNICLEEDNDEHRTCGKNTCLPIPPHQEFLHLLLLVVIVKEIQD
jgi:hypothetical protein